MDGRRSNSSSSSSVGGGSRRNPRREASEEQRRNRRDAAGNRRRGLQEIYNEVLGPARMQFTFSEDPFEEDERELQSWQTLREEEWSRIRALTLSHEIKEEFKAIREARGLPPLDEKDYLLLTVLSAVMEMQDKYVPGSPDLYDELGNLGQFIDNQHILLNPDVYYPRSDVIELSDSDDE